MSRKPKITTETLNQVVQAAGVRAALAARARIYLPRAQRIAAQSGATAFGKSLRILEGTRPGTKSAGGLKRPYARVQGDASAEVVEADKGARLTRIQILRRASG